MPGAEGLSERLVVVGGPQVIEVVEPIAVELGLQPDVQETLRGAIGAVGLAAEGVTGVVIDAVSRPRRDGDTRLYDLIDGLWRLKDEPIPTALIAAPSAIGHFRHKYAFGVYTEPWAALLYPPEADVVSLWVRTAIQAKRERA